jgi:hypothetical protein
VDKERKFPLREHAVHYMANFDLKNEDIRGKTSAFWKDSYYLSS